MEAEKIKGFGVDSAIIDAIKKELNGLEDQLLEINGKQFKPSQCYRFGTNPVHILFNTNCPAELKQKVNAIINRYLPIKHESSTPE